MLESTISTGRVSLEQKVLWARNMSVMLHSGLTIEETLEVTADQATGTFKKVLTGLHKAISSGQPLGDGMARYPKVFEESFINVVRAGEASGNLEENLTNIAENLEKERELRSKIKGAMLYPTVVLVAALILGLAMSFLVLPKIVPLFEGLKVDLPATTRALIWFSHVVRDYTWQLLIGVIGGVVGLIWLFKRRFFKPVSHWLWLRLPIVSKLTRYTNQARFCRTLGTLLQSGLNIDEALEIAGSTVNNYYYRGALKHAAQSISKGGSLSAALSQHQNLFPILVTRMVGVGEQSGNTSETLLFLAHFYEVEVETSTKSLATAIEPVLLIIIGLGVGFLALSIITPIYEITGNIRR